MFQRKLVALGLALIMVAAMSVTAVAASTSDDTTTKIKNGIRGMFAGDKGAKFAAPGQSLSVVAELTGLTETELQTQLKAGKTLAEIAATKNVSSDDLIAALVKDVQAKLDTAKSEGKITQEQYNQCTSNLQERITNQVTQAPPAGGVNGKGMRGQGHGRGPGMAPNAAPNTNAQVTS